MRLTVMVLLLASFMFAASDKFRVVRSNRAVLTQNIVIDFIQMTPRAATPSVVTGTIWVKTDGKMYVEASGSQALY
jgi:hypothetical protein